MAPGGTKRNEINEISTPQLQPNCSSKEIKICFNGKNKNSVGAI
jgi:hypothetical protein